MAEIGLRKNVERGEKTYFLLGLFYIFGSQTVLQPPPPLMKDILQQHDLNNLHFALVECEFITDKLPFRSLLLCVQLSLELLLSRLRHQILKVLVTCPLGVQVLVHDLQLTIQIVVVRLQLQSENIGVGVNLSLRRPH